MSTLQQNINQRRAAEFPAWECVTITLQTPGVLVSIWDGDAWVLPWSYLINTRFFVPPDGDTLMLTFGSHVVTARGRNLRQILGDVAAFRVAAIANLPPAYAAKFANDTPFIGQLDVQSVSAGEATPKTPN